MVSYYIGGDIRRTLSEGLESLTGPPFLINHRTGDLSLNFYPQKGMKGYFDFEVVANDTEGFYDTASVFVSTFSCRADLALLTNVIEDGIVLSKTTCYVFVHFHAF